MSCTNSSCSRRQRVSAFAQGEEPAADTVARMDDDWSEKKAAASSSRPTGGKGRQPLVSSNVSAVG